MRHTETYKVNTHDVDCNGNLSPTGYMRYLQDSAHCQLVDEKPSYDDLFDRGLAFVLSRFKAEFYESVHSQETVEADTWAVDEASAASFKRCYEMRRDGKVVARAKSIWAIFNMNTGRICRISEAGVSYGSDADLDMEISRRIKPAKELRKVGEHTVMYGDIDKNLHMNNTRYADMLCGYIPDITKKRVTSFDIYYAAEAHFGDTIEIYIGECEGAYYFKTLRSDSKVNVEALIQCESI